MTKIITFKNSDVYGEVEQRGHLSKLAKWQRLELNSIFNHVFLAYQYLAIPLILVNSFSGSVSQSISQSDRHPVPCLSQWGFVRSPTEDSQLADFQCFLVYTEQ